MVAEITLLRRQVPANQTALQSHQVVQRKAFLRKTARGRVFRVLREQYLRDDVPCGSLACSLCSELYESSLAPILAYGNTETQSPQRGRAVTAAPVLSSQARPACGSLGPHYLVLDTNVVLHQMDILESTASGADFIVPQTVLDEVRHRSLPLYNRLNVLLGDPDRRMWCFDNEACAAAHTRRLDGESPNDYNDRAIRRAAQWYKEHLHSAAHGFKRRKLEHHSRLDIVLLSDDSNNRRKANEAGIKSFAVREYIAMLPEQVSSSLQDLLAAKDGGSEELQGSAPEIARRSAKAAIYDEHLALSDMLAGIRSGILFQGHFNPNPYNYLEGSMNVPTLNQPILLVGRECINRATDGDVVAVQVFDESQWKVPTDELIDAEASLANDDPDPSDDEGDDLANHEARQREREAAATRKAQRRKDAAQPTGKVVGIIKRAWRAYVCHLDRNSLAPSALESHAPQNVFAVPVDRKFPKIRIRTRQAGTLVGQKFLVTPDRWDVTSRYPEGHFVRALGRVESKEAEIESLLLEYDVPYRPFSKQILACLPEEGDSWKVPPRGANPAWRGREDLRELTICSIDPPGCQDIDDALHARHLPNGHIEAGVHIADVSYFVQPDNPMDSEAASRGTTVYLVDKRIDMLPSLLGTNLCSLRPHVERLAFSVLWELDEKADIVNVRFTKSVIASKMAFTYEEAQKRKDDRSLDDELTQGIRLLNQIAIKLRSKRMAAGALNLASPEVKIHMDTTESSGPIDVEQKQLLETNSLVEEFMLLANISVASRIYQQFPQTAVLRRHLPPPTGNFDVLKDVLLKRKGLTLDVSSSGALARSLDQCEDPSIPDFNTLVRIMATRCMLSAEYFCSGSIARDAFGHYGLATPIYTHFTSPIRRYADVLAHRELQAAVTNTSLHAALHSKTHVDRIMDNINRRHRSAQQAGRASVEFYVALSLRGREEASIKAGQGRIREDAFVIRAFRNGIAVFVSRLGLEGLVTFKRDHRYDADNYALTLKSEAEGQDVTIGVFDRVVVEITVEKDRNTQRGRVKMQLVEPVDTTHL